MSPMNTAARRDGESETTTTQAQTKGDPRGSLVASQAGGKNSSRVNQLANSDVEHSGVITTEARDEGRPARVACCVSGRWEKRSGGPSSESPPGDASGVSTPASSLTIRSIVCKQTHASERTLEGSRRGGAATRFRPSGRGVIGRITQPRGGRSGSSPPERTRGDQLVFPRPEEWGRTSSRSPISKGLILAQNERWRRGLGMQVERPARGVAQG